MSELDVIVIHVRAEQAAEYERLFAERERPRWREYMERCAFISARIFRAAFGTDRRQDIAKYVIAVEVPSHTQHSKHDADPGFQEFNRLADAFQPEDPPDERLLCHRAACLRADRPVLRSLGSACAILFRFPRSRGGWDCALDERGG